jgi:hypothetical protein
MKIQNLKIKTPSGKEYKISGNVEFDHQLGYRVKKITHIDNKKSTDNQIIRSYISHDHIKQAL